MQKLMTTDLFSGSSKSHRGMSSLIDLNKMLTIYIIEHCDTEEKRQRDNANDYGCMLQ